MSPPAALEVRELVAGYEPGSPVVRGASIVLGGGELVALLGPNGAGKSTLVKAIAGLVPIESGRVVLGGADVTGRPAHRMVHAGLAFVPQTDNVFARLTVEENLELATFFLAGPERRRQMAAVYALFPDLARRPRLAAGRLSGGQRQMLALARALAVRPRVLVLDEPSAGLSPRLVHGLLERLGEVRAGGMAVLVVEQNARAALAVANRGYVLVDGRERIAGPATALLADPEVARLYLGGASSSR